jgi:NTP pyrophosphatase (non-canonical NTP hydrolase)
MTVTTPDFNALAARVHQTAVDHGWWESERDFDEMCFLMTTELAEAFEEYREQKPLVYYSREQSTPPKPEGIATELADVVIRALDTILTVSGGVDLNVEVGQCWKVMQLPPENIGRAFRLIDKRINRAADHGRSKPMLTTTNLLIIMIMCHELSAKLGCKDFWAVVEEKMAYNDTRPYRHGGKLA